MFDHTPEKEDIEYIKEMIKKFQNSRLFIDKVVSTRE